jgi:PAS domain S-box-containing protein
MGGGAAPARSIAVSRSRTKAQAKGRTPKRAAKPVAPQARLRQAERRLREVEERYALATSAALEGIYEWDLAAGRLFLTERAKEFFALAGEDLTPAAWNARIHADDYSGYRAAIVDHFKGRTPHLEHEYRIADATGGYKWVLDRGVGVRNAKGRITKVVGALSDITQRKLAEIELRGARDRAEEALEQQTAMSEILRVMSRSPTDAQPVFDLVAQRAGRLCGADVALVSRFDGNQIELAAIDGVVPEVVRIARSLYPMQISAQTVTARAIRSAKVVHIADVLEDPTYAIKDFAVAAHFRAGLGVPIVRDQQVIGTIFVGRPKPGLFAESQVDLLKAFADQAAIAIEDVRLFNELKTRNRDLTEALEQQTATSEILRVISRSPTDARPVFDTIAEAALKLCDASSALVFTFDGKLIQLAAVANVNPEGADAWRRSFPRPPSRDTAATRAVLTCSIVAIPDVLDDPDYVIGPTAAATGFGRALAVPLLRDGKAIGVIGVGRPKPGPFRDNQIALLQTFADQAVIAIENVRLFTELEARTHALTRSVGELKALGEVGQAVSSTLDLETVLSTVVSRAAQLAGMDGGSIWEYDEERKEFYLHATDRLPDQLVEVLRATPIRKGEGALGRLALTGEPAEIRDIADERSYPSQVRELLTRCGYRSVLAVPLLREDHLLGALAVHQKSSDTFALEVVDLLKTFATQSTLAIQHARLFREIEDKSRQLEVASRHKSEFLANMSHELRTPLNAIIGFSEVLAERMFGEINDKQAEYLSDILESGRHLLSLINDILDLSKIEAGRMELEPADFDLPTAIGNTLTLVRERAQRRGITLANVVDERLGTVRADERKVKQVLLNLLSNALKFTPEGGRIDVRARVDDGAAQISVSDTGVGIAPDDQAAVFEEFRQVGAAAKKVEGTGLGLAISKKIIELHGGRIWVESRPGAGSTFSFTLPLVRQAPIR